MPSDRDTLAGLIAQELDFHYSIDSDNCEAIEAGIAAGCTAALAAGWRPPAREITTAGELEKLPMDSIVVDHHGAGWQMTDRDYDGTAIWQYRSAARSSAELLAGGARVTAPYIPTEEGRDRG